MKLQEISKGGVLFEQNYTILFMTKITSLKCPISSDESQSDEVCLQWLQFHFGNRLVI